MSSDDDAIPVKAVDTEELVRGQRLRSLFEAKQDCRDIRHRAQDAVSDDKRATYAANSHFRHAVESYAREAETLFSKTDEGQRYWNAHDFGKLYVSPEIEHKSTHKGSVRILAETGSRLAGEVPRETIDITGLGTLFELQSPLSFEMQVPVEVKRRGGGATLERINVEQQISFGILDDMYAVVNAYLSEIGLDVEIEPEGANEWDI